MNHFYLTLLISISLLNSVVFAKSNNLYRGAEYKTLEDKKSIFGVLNCKGSTNVEKLLEIWVPKFKQLYPDVKSNLDFKGSGQGIKALLAGNANIAAASRPIKQKERDLFIRVKGYAPTEVKISLDALAVYVNRQNRLDSITLPQLDAIFSTSLKQNYNAPIENWKALTGIDDKINIYLYDKNSGTRSYFRKKVMKKGEFNNKNIVSDKFTKLSEVITKVASDPHGICFGSLEDKNYRVKVLSISKGDFFPSFKPKEENIKDKKYLLTRFFYIYLDVPPDKSIPILLYEFCKYILSGEGQSVVSKIGGLPLGAKQVGIELSKIRR
jgi:phosphate transport system substrate-binding protein